MIALRLWLVALCLAAAGGALKLAAASDMVPAAHLDTLPFAISGWRGQDDGRLDAETERAIQADSYMLRTYTRNGAQASLYVAYYATQRSGHTIHSPLNCLPGTGWTWLERGRTRVNADGASIEVNRALAQKDSDRLLLYYWYQSRGRVIASDYRNKLTLMHDAFTQHRSDGALVRIVAPVVDGADHSAAVESFIASMYPALAASLPN
jgi:EpsI family protein